MPEFEDVIVERGIRWLCHFTPVENLDKIKKSEGLKLRSNISGNYTCTDEDRRDSNNDAICVSVSEPNPVMMRQKSENYNLCMLLINPDALNNDCLFYPHNAATQNYRGLPNDNFKGVESFKAMFDDTITYTKANECNPNKINRYSTYYPCQTTSYQAEIQFLTDIPAQYIEYVIHQGTPLNWEEINKLVSECGCEENSIIEKLVNEVESNESQSY